MVPEKLRKLVADKCGSERYRRFLETMNRKVRKRGRLAYWQQDLLDELTSDYPEIASISFDELVSTFRLCHVHLVPLTDCDVPIERSVTDVYLAPEYEAASREQFPFSPTFVLAVEEYEGQTHIVLDQCSECMKARERFSSGRDTEL